MKKSNLWLFIFTVFICGFSAISTCQSQNFQIQIPDGNFDTDINTNNKSYIESKRTTMRIGLTGYIEGFGAPTYIYMDYGSIGINKTPHANSPTNGSINATLQINGGIQISNNSTISTSSPGNNCSPNQAGMIQYYNGDFYGCNGSAWKKFDMSSIQSQGSGIR